MDFAIEYIHAEDEQTKYIDIGPVKLLSLFFIDLEAYPPPIKNLLKN